MPTKPAAAASQSLPASDDHLSHRAGHVPSCVCTSFPCGDTSPLPVKEGNGVPVFLFATRGDGMDTSRLTNRHRDRPKAGKTEYR